MKLMKLVLMSSLIVLARMETFLEMDDLLNEELMPTSVLLLDSKTTRKEPFQEQKYSIVGYNGSWNDAYVTMGFHRKMLNEYLCRNFLAEEIISEIQGPLISRRAGRPFSKPGNTSKSGFYRQSRKENNDVKENLLSDPGSSNYRDWLTKTATLEDVYRHYEKDRSDSREDFEEFDGGEITGYAMQNPGNEPMYPPHGYGYPAVIPQPEPADQEKHGGDFDYTPHHVHFHSGGDEEKSHHMILNDVFDAALTALAFLSFGMFILQVIMCITSNKPMQMMQMTDPGTGGGNPGNPTGAEEIDGLRFKRDIIGNSFLDEISRKVLTSIEVGIKASEDNGHCLRRVLCENNKYSRTTKDGRRLWIPVWGLGMSWLSSKFINLQSSSTIMLDSLKACAFGLASSDCSILYPRCNLRHLLDSGKNASQTFPASDGKLKGDIG